jgi:hypothetical protein
VDHHSQQHHAVAEAVYLRFAVLAVPVTYRDFDDLEVHFAGSEQQIEITEGIEITEV